MDFAVFRRSTPLKKGKANEFKTAKHPGPGLPARGCHLAVCSVFMNIVCIEISSFDVRESKSREPSCIK